MVNKKNKRNKLSGNKPIVDFIKVQRHFFKDLSKWIDELEDPRNKSYITYTQQDLFYLGILKNVCGIKTMRQMNEKFNEEECINSLSFMSEDKELKELPDFTTLNNYLEKLSPKCLSDLRNKMVTSLIRSKAFNKNRLLGKYWVIILDGTGLFHFKEKHCENCLVTTHTDDDGTKHKHYYHKVLEAKIVLSDSIVISLGTEFIENEKEDVKKQDCENAAAKRLLERIKKEHPRLRICVLGDALYGVEPVMKICKEYGWKYIFNLKEGTQKNIVKDYDYLENDMKNVMRILLGVEKGKGSFYNHMEKITGKEEIFNVFTYEYSKVKKQKEQKVKFMWVTNIELKAKNLKELIAVGRKRWKIENEGFNNQKNGIYQIEHLNSRNSNAMKNHYLLTQIADILMQLYLNCDEIVKKVNESIKNTSSRLLESFRIHIITEEDVLHISRYTTIHFE